MKKIKEIHTPAPWRASEESATIWGPDGYRVASVNKYQDVNLIKAAPALYAALHRAVEYFDENGGEESYTWLPMMKEALNQAAPLPTPAREVRA